MALKQALTRSSGGRSHKRWNTRAEVKLSSRRGRREEDRDAVNPWGPCERCGTPAVDFLCRNCLEREDATRAALSDRGVIHYWAPSYAASRCGIATTAVATITWDLVTCEACNQTKETP